MPRRTGARTALLAALAIALAPALVIAGPAQRAHALAAPPLPLAYAPSFVAAAGGATTGVAGAGSAAVASGTLGAAPAVTAGSVVIGGLTVGLMIGEAGLRLYNLTQAQKDQIPPLSSLLIDQFTPTDPGKAPGPATVGDGQNWTSGQGTYKRGTQTYSQGYSDDFRASWLITAANSGPAGLSATVKGLQGTVSGEWYADWECSTSGAHIGKGGQYANALAPGASQTMFFAFPTGTAQAYGCAGSWNFSYVGPMPGNGAFTNWFPGTPDPVAPADPGPSRLETRSTCSGVVKVASTAQFTRTGVWPAPAANPCPGGELPSLVEVWEVNGAGSTRLTTWSSPAVSDPNLAPKPGARLDLQRANPDGQWVSCFSIPGPCSQWYADPNKAQNFRCTYGGAVVALSECNVYKPSFDTSAKTPYGAPDGTVPPPSPSNPTGEPKTPLPDPAGPPGQPNPSDSDGTRCFPNGWGLLNPVEWVVRPLRCAFEPSEASVRSATTKVRTAVETGGPGPLVTAIGGVFGAFSGWGAAAGDCRGPAITWSGHTIVSEAFTAYPFDACSGIRQTVASYARTLGTLVIWIAAVVTGTATVARAFGIDLPFTASNEED